MSERIRIRDIVIEIKGDLLTLTLEEARHLYSELHDLLGEKASIDIPNAQDTSPTSPLQVPYTPYTPSSPAPQFPSFPGFIPNNLPSSPWSGTGDPLLTSNSPMNKLLVESSTGCDVKERDSY